MCAQVFKNAIPRSRRLGLRGRTAVCVAALDEEHPQCELRPGFDPHVRLLKLVFPLWDDGTEEIIHSMTTRKQDLPLLS